MNRSKFCVLRLIAVFFVLCFCLVALVGCGKSNGLVRLVETCQLDEIGVDITEQIKNYEQDIFLLQDNNRRLFINDKAVLYVVDNNDTIIWQSALVSSSEIEVVHDSDVARSSIVVNYKLDASSDHSLNSLSQCFEKGQFCISKSEDKIIIQQIIGEYIDEILIPEAIEKSRFENLLKKFAEQEAKFLTRQYALYTPEMAKRIENAEILNKIPNLKDKSFYVLNLEPTTALTARLKDTFAKIGYTTADLENDRQEAGISITDQGLVYKLVTEFSFENGDLIVNVPCDQIYYPSSEPLLFVDLFKYGLYSTENSEGYYFIPSGSGALFNFKEGKLPYYQLKYYGEDYSNSNGKKEIDRSSYPVFAKTNGTNGCLAIIEKGAENVTLNLNSVQGGYILYPSIELFPNKLSALSGGNFSLYANKPFVGDVSIRYKFLEGEESSYSGMANCYREYLTNNDMLRNDNLNENVPFSMELINSIQTTDNIVGITYKTEKVTTTFEQCKNIVSYFHDNGVSNIFVKLNGANKEGLFVQEPGKFKASSKAGGKSEYLSLIKYLKENQISVFTNLNIAFSYDCNKNLGGYSSKKNNACMIDDERVTIAIKEKSTNAEREDLPSIDVVSPYFYESYIDEYVKHKDRIASGISIGELGWVLNSDFSDKHYSLRADSKEATIKGVETLSDSFEIMAENPNDYLLSKLSFGEKIPTESTGYRYFDESVPFVQMVLHGKFQYTTEYWNEVSNNKKMLLKAIETGSGISYRFTESLEKDDMKDYNSFLYNTDYQLWKEKALENYNYVNIALKGLNNKNIVKHHYIDKDFVQVTYSNGSVIYINYSNVEKTVDDVTIDGLSYLRK